MRRTLLIVALALFSASAFCQQAKKPTLMLLPSDHWCSDRLFTTKFDSQGKTVVVNDYEKAFRQDGELPGVVAKVGELLTERGYMVKDYMKEAQAVNDRHAEDEVTMSSAGSEIFESPLDVLRRTVKYDVEIALDWDIASNGDVSFSIGAFDTYTSKRVATASGSLKGSKVKGRSIAAVLDEAVKAQLPAFTAQLDKYFLGLQENGREIILTVRIWDSSADNLETEYDDVELLEAIQDFLADNTVNGAFTLTSATENRADFEQVRIPFFNSKGRALDARSFGMQLKRYLAKEPFSLESKIMTRGLGEVIIIIGEK